MAGFECVREFFPEEEMSKVGTEELVTVIVSRLLATSNRNRILAGLENKEFFLKNKIICLFLAALGLRCCMWAFSACRATYHLVLKNVSFGDCLC